MAEYRFTIEQIISVDAKTRFEAISKVELPSGQTALKAEPIARCQICRTEINALFRYTFCKEHCPHQTIIYAGNGDDVCQQCGEIW